MTNPNDAVSHDTLDAFIAMVKLIEPEQNPAARKHRFVALYRTAEDSLDLRSLSEPEYDQLFSAMSAACGFDDPLDALEALAHGGRIAA